MPPIINNNSDRTFSLVRGWLQDCLTIHSDDEDDDDKEDEAVPLPRRVLEGTSGGETVRLVKTNSVTSRYYALSHSWALLPNAFCRLLSQAF
jgi:hypothetical protein